MDVYIACFDISDDALRRRISQRLEHFGVRVQRSVFELAIDSLEQLNALKTEIAGWVADQADQEDDVRFYPLCKNCRRKASTHDDQRVAYFPAATLL